MLAAGLAPVVAGFDPLSLDPFAIPDVSTKGPDDRSDTAWRIRHLPRSILKDTTDRASSAPSTSGSPTGTKPLAASGAGLARALGAPARLLNDLPLTGQVNLMTSGSFDGSQSPSSSDSAVRGTAFFALADQISSGLDNVETAIAGDGLKAAINAVNDLARQAGETYDRRYQVITGSGAQQ